MRTLHVGLRVTDLARSVAFYTSVGYEVLGEVRPSESLRLTMLKLPDDDYVSLELVHEPGRDRVDPTGLSHLVITVDDLDRTVEELDRRGIAADAPTSPDGSHEMWTSWITDPDGFRIELVQWPPGHPPGMTRADLGPGDPQR
jgi:lactoylglutathione lyase